jgi:hypothetical protein
MHCRFPNHFLGAIDAVLDEMARCLDAMGMSVDMSIDSVHHRGGVYLRYVTSTIVTLFGICSSQRELKEGQKEGMSEIHLYRAH